MADKGLVQNAEGETPGKEQYMIYLLENTDKLDESFIKEAEPYLSKQRIERINSIRPINDKINGCAVYLLLRYGLLCEYGITEAPVFDFGEHGKPGLRDTPEIHFNMSHAKNAVCCIVSESETAIDITDIRPLKHNVVRRVCDEREQGIIYASAEPDRTFLKMWTLKECLSKLSGKGMSVNFASLTDMSEGAGAVHTIEKSEYILSYYSMQEKKIVITDKTMLLRRLRTTL